MRVLRVAVVLFALALVAALLPAIAVCIFAHVYAAVERAEREDVRREPLTQRSVPLGRGCMAGRVGH
jgi:hypothetical protein